MNECMNDERENQNDRLNGDTERPVQWLRVSQVLRECVEMIMPFRWIWAVFMSSRVSQRKCCWIAEADWMNGLGRACESCRYSSGYGIRTLVQRPNITELMIPDVVVLEAMIL